MSSGNKSKNLLAFIHKYFVTENFDPQIYNSLAGIAGNKQVYEVNVAAYPHDCEYVQQEVRYVTDFYKDRPVIYFGPPQPKECFGLPEGSFIRRVGKDDFDGLQAVQFEATGYSNGVVGLHEQPGIGVDIRFKTDALVVIASKNLPDSEMCQQMVSRGVRFLGPQQGMIFVQDQPSHNASEQVTQSSRHRHEERGNKP